MDRSLLFNIVMNMDIENLYQLSLTSNAVNNFLNEKYTMTALSKKYNIRYHLYEDYTFFDLVWDVLVEKIGYEDRNLYLKDEIIRAVGIINNRFLGSGHKITNCDYEYNIKGKYTSWLCQAAMFLKKNGFDINQIFTAVDDVYDYKEIDQIYKDWLRLLKMKALSYPYDTLLDKPFTSYTNGQLI